VSGINAGHKWTICGAHGSTKLKFCCRMFLRMVFQKENLCFILNVNYVSKHRPLEYKDIVLFWSRGVHYCLLVLVKTWKNYGLQWVVLVCSSLFGLLGTLRRCGLQKIGAIVMIRTLYVIGIPLSVVLGCAIHLIKGTYTILRLKFFTGEVHEL
jgi:hypothetical protein